MVERDSLLSSLAPVAASEILIVGSSDSRASVMQATSSLALHVVEADSIELGLVFALQKASALDCAILESGVTGIDFWSLVRSLRSNAETSAVPIVALLPQAPSDSAQVRLIEAGVMDYLVRPLDPALVTAKVKAISERARAQREIIQKLRFALEYSTLDPLTKLFNRRYFERRLREESIHAKRQKMPLSIVVLDLDHFKVINDTYGHEAGDRVLCHFAEMLVSSLRDDDVSCRIGGEEFVLLLRATPGAAARVVANKLRVALASKPIALGPTGEPRPFTFSGGVASADDRNEYATEKLFDRADRALYRAKNGGRDRIELE